MPYLFTCPHCQTKTLVDDQYSGQAGRCVTCGSAIEVPAFAALESPSPAQAATPGAPRRGAKGIGPRGRRLVAAAVCLVVIGCVVIAVQRYVKPLVASLQASRAHSLSLRNIEKIAAALNAYAADHRSYPPPVILAPDGQPLHSWRVTILPYLGEEKLYESYDFNEPWDSPQNQGLIAQMPAVYRPASGMGPAGPIGSGTEAAYVLLTGTGTLFPPAPHGGFLARSPRDVSDALGQTLLVAEGLASADGSVHWSQPGDLEVTAMHGLIGAAPGREIGGVHPEGAVVATVDGRGHFLDQNTNPLTVMGLITIAGGEPLGDDVLDR